MTPLVSVILPTHNPDPGRLERTLAGLCNQTLPLIQWETILIDNASTQPPAAAFLARHGPSNLKVLHEPVLGLTVARRFGFAACAASVAVLVDDDNVLAPDYLEQTLTLLAAHSRVGALGGRVRPEFVSEPPAWTREFHGLLALRDLGDTPLISEGLRPRGTKHNEYPLFAPMGAGMVLRREAWTAWADLCRTRQTSPTDRCGNELTSSGDNDIVLALMRAGWEVGYFPDLSLTHLIPSARLEPNYLARLNYGIQKSWQQVLALHEASPWSRLTRIGVALRKIKAWAVCKPWTSSAARVRWQGVCGHFDGRVSY
jgi:glycosyltransferase involved in cell wall biosynthesis